MCKGRSGAPLFTFDLGENVFEFVFTQLGEELSDLVFTHLGEELSNVEVVIVFYFGQLAAVFP